MYRSDDRLLQSGRMPHACTETGMRMARKFGCTTCVGTANNNLIPILPLELRHYQELINNWQSVRRMSMDRPGWEINCCRQQSGIDCLRVRPQLARLERSLHWSGLITILNGTMQAMTRKNASESMRTNAPRSSLPITCSPPSFSERTYDFSSALEYDADCSRPRSLNR